MSESPWLQLHPASVAVNLLPRTWRFIRSAWPFLVAMLYGGRDGMVSLVDMALLTVFFASAVGGTIVHWATLRYRMANGLLEIKSGLLNRQLRTIDPARVQNVEMTQSMFHRMAGLVEVRIETASGAEAEGLLSALTREEAAALVDALRAGQKVSALEQEEEIVIAHGLRELLLFGVTDARWGAAVVVFGLFLEGMPFSGPDQLLGLSSHGFEMALLIPAILVGTWLMSTVTAVVRYYGFRLIRGPHGWIAEHGLFTRRRVEIRVGKLQTVTVLQPWLRRKLGFASLEFVTAASQGPNTRLSQAMIPVVPDERLDEVLRILAPGGEGWADLQLQPPDPKALVRGLVAAGVRSALIAGAATFWLWPWGLLAWLWVPTSLWIARLDHRNQGWSVDDHRLVTRKGFLDRRTEWMPRGKVQSSVAAQGPLLARYGLGLLRVRAAGSAVTLPPLAWKTCVEIGARLSKARRPLHPLPAAAEGEANGTTPLLPTGP